jgi:hypothetical protein
MPLLGQPGPAASSQPLKELDEERASSQDKAALRRTQAMIEKTRTLMNCKMSGWVRGLEIICVEISKKNTRRF